MAVYTEVADEELQAFTAEYDIGDVLSCKGIAEGVENTNYLLHTEGSTFILTLYEKRVAPDALPFYLGLMAHLADNGILCPTPVKARDGSALRTLCGRPAAIVTFLEGMWPRRIQVEHCAQVGSALAKMHLAAASFGMKNPNALSIRQWRPLFASCRERSNEVSEEIADIIEAELSHLEANWPSDLPVGICHADLFPDNVFFIAGQLSGMIDFYFACNDHLAYDVATCLNAWCFERDMSFNITKARHLLSNYRNVRDVSSKELESLPLLARGSALRFMLTRLFDWLNQPEGALVRPKNPLEYLAILQFHQGVGGPGAYGL
jgi:homoserine kinase type II